MSGLQTMIEDVLTATATPPKKGDFIWDGMDENERPLSKEEMLKGITNQEINSNLLNSKWVITMKYDQNILEYFKATGKGWQKRMNDVLADYVASH